VPQAPRQPGTIRAAADARLPVLLTSAINVSAPFTKMSDAPARVAATLQSTSNWLRLCRDTEFVLCDGSGYDLSRDFKASGLDTTRIEFITFQNDSEQVRAKGKGFGEGQITKYALENSAILKAATAFAKCTGKLWVDNFSACRAAYNGTAGFSYFGFLSLHAVDTRFFIVTKDFFQQNLVNSYLDCDDSHGKYLENVYLESLVELDRRAWLLSVYPTVRGLSGTSGQPLQSDLFKQVGKNLAIRVLRSGIWSRP
jgi:hypothetical protein